jgi:hypothetical protein
VLAKEVVVVSEGCSGGLDVIEVAGKVLAVSTLSSPPVIQILREGDSVGVGFILVLAENSLVEHFSDAPK